MKTAISIPDPLFGAAERLAKRLGLSRSELYQRALQAFLQRHNDDGVTEALDKIYGPASEDGSLDPLFEQLQLASLPKDEWC